MEISFDRNAANNEMVERTVNEFLTAVPTIEKARGIPVHIFQDGVKSSYYVRCTISGETMSRVISLDARLDPQSTEGFRDNRELLCKHNTFLRMQADAEKGREFSDIITEYVTDYQKEKPLKVWGGQHRSRAIIDAYVSQKISRNHGFRIYFCLTKEQRAELALVSNTNIAVSNDLFDRQLEETYMGPHLRRWSRKVGLIKKNEDFLDLGSRAEGLTTQTARTFIVNYFKGKKIGEQLADEDLDRNVYEPYIAKSGIGLDEEYRSIVENLGQALWSDAALAEAGKAFAALHKAQHDAIKKSNIDRKSYRMKVLAPSVVASWSYVAGLLQNHQNRLKVHLTVPPTPRGAPDPLNADEMASFVVYQDSDSKGLGTRANLKDRQRMAQLFLARTIDPDATFTRKLMDQAVNQVTALRFFSRGYAA